MKASEIVGVVTQLKDQVAKSKAEIVARIAALEAALSDLELSPAAVDAFAALKAEVQGVDDLNADTVTTPTEPTT